ncbi:unnamed protein product [Ectocarpus sp. 12 AP-2014]
MFAGTKRVPIAVTALVSMGQVSGQCISAPYVAWYPCGTPFILAPSSCDRVRLFSHVHRETGCVSANPIVTVDFTGPIASWGYTTGSDGELDADISDDQLSLTYDIGEADLDPVSVESEDYYYWHFALHLDNCDTSYTWSDNFVQLSYVDDEQNIIDLSVFQDPDIDEPDTGICREYGPIGSANCSIAITFANSYLYAFVPSHLCFVFPSAVTMINRLCRGDISIFLPCVDVAFSLVSISLNQFRRTPKTSMSKHIWQSPAFPSLPSVPFPSCPVLAATPRPVVPSPSMPAPTPAPTTLHLIGRSVGKCLGNQKQDKLKLCYHSIYSAGRQLLRLSVHFVVVPVGIKTRGTSVMCYVGCSLFPCTFLVRCFAAVEMKAAALVENVSNCGTPLTANVHCTHRELQKFTACWANRLASRRATSIKGLASASSVTLADQSRFPPGTLNIYRPTPSPSWSPQPPTPHPTIRDGEPPTPSPSTSPPAQGSSVALGCYEDDREDRVMDDLALSDHSMITELCELTCNGSTCSALSTGGSAGVVRLVRTTPCTGGPPTAPTPAQGTLTNRAAGSTPPTSTFTRARAPLAPLLAPRQTNLALLPLGATRTTATTVSWTTATTVSWTTSLFPTPR